MADRADAIARVSEHLHSGAFIAELGRRVAYRTESQTPGTGAALRAYLVENLQPVRFVIENGVLTGMEFDRFKSVETESGLKQEVIGREILPCDTVVLAIGQDNAFPFIERNIGLEFGKWDMPVVDKTTFMSTRPGVFFGGDAAFGPKNIIWAVAHGHAAAISIHQYLNGEGLHDRPPPEMNLVSQKMGLHEWSYDNDISGDPRFRVPWRDKALTLRDIAAEVELGYDSRRTPGIYSFRVEDVGFVLRNDDRVRVLEYKDQPGQKTHQHAHPAFVVYAVSPFKRELILPDGRKMQREFKAGAIMWSDAQTHIGNNIGDTPTHVIMIEMKK